MSGCFVVRFADDFVNPTYFEAINNFNKYHTSAIAITKKTKNTTKIAHCGCTGIDAGS